MQIIHTTAELRNALAAYGKTHTGIGFVPTMGALHEGHIQLVTRCAHENNLCVVSIFVNPTQFNDPNDLTNYPRTPEKDCALLEKAGCDLVFMPSVEEMYPSPDTRVFDFGSLATVMEGNARPGHFNGVAQIVSKLFDSVQPNRAYFGEKDFQQLAIIRELVRQQASSIEIVACPIVREADGLAMSSRNRRLSPEEREKANQIAALLFKSRTFVGNKTIQETIQWITDELGKVPVFRLDYFEIVDGKTLQPIESWDASEYIVGCVAVFCGKVRLIDNIEYKHAN